MKSIGFREAQWRLIWWCVLEEKDRRCNRFCNGLYLDELAFNLETPGFEMTVHFTGVEARMNTCRVKVNPGTVSMSLED